MLKVFELPYLLRKNVRGKVNSFKKSKSWYFIKGGGTGIIIGLFWDIKVYSVKNVVTLLW